MSDTYLPLDELGEIVRVKTGITVTGEAIDAGTAIGDLGVDSLGWLGVISEVENRYGVTLDSSAEDVSTLPEMVALVNDLLAPADRRPGRTDNRVVVDAPLDVVWAATNDVETWPRLFTEYAEAVVLERDGDTVRFRLSTYPDDQGTVYSWVSERTADEAARTVRAHRVETGLFDHMDITWTYREVGNGVEMRWIQEFAMKPGGPATDAQMTAYINTNSVVQMAHIKTLIESGLAPVGPASDGRTAA